MRSTVILLFRAFSCHLVTRINEVPECIKDYRSPTAEFITKAKDIMKDTGVFDGHNDLAMTFTFRNG